MYFVLLLQLLTDLEEPTFSAILCKVKVMRPYCFDFSWSDNCSYVRHLLPAHFIGDGNDCLWNEVRNSTHFANPKTQVLVQLSLLLYYQ